VGKILTFDLHGGKISVRQIPWARQGDVTAWLVSEAFGLRQASSAEAEQAKAGYSALQRTFAFSRGISGANCLLEIV